MLGLGSMFGTLEGIITSLNDSNLVAIKKPLLSAIICTSSCLIGLVFTTHAGQVSYYYFSMIFILYDNKTYSKIQVIPGDSPVVPHLYF